MNKTEKAIIFDMDGIIFDSEKVYYDAFFIAADTYEIDVNDAFVHQFAGKSAPVCQNILLDFFGGDYEKTRRFLRDWLNARIDILSEHGLDYKPGFLELFEWVQQLDCPIGLVTSSNRDDLEENFKRNDVVQIDDFDAIITIDDVKYPKPHPQPYQHMIRRLEQAPENCIVIEDSISGVTSAVKAGTKTIMLAEHVQPNQELANQLFYLTDHHDNIRPFLRNHGF